MKAGQIMALILAILLLIPGGCFLLVGIAVSSGNHEDIAAASQLVGIAVAILALAGFLFWIAFRRRNRGNP